VGVQGAKPLGLLFELAPAKVNLFLHVTDRRADGYHVLDSLAIFAGVHDVVSAEPADALSLRVTGPFAAALTEDNLVLRAARALGARRALRLEKNLPVASGIGGGSADAAAALRLLAGSMPAAELARIAAGLGADVPVCLACAPARMGGVGEVLSAAPHLPEFGLALINPGVGVATPEVFRARSRPFSGPASLPAGWASAAAMAEDLAHLTNDLEAPAMALCPAIGDVLAALRATDGCLLARMSGSGATCFALFDTPARAAAAAACCARPGWWCWGGARFAPGGGFTGAAAGP
jgi:4-diphosphocytidyl-2-C-methyl-D-erythritol kinase